MCSGFFIFNSFPSLIGLIFWRDVKGTINFEQPEANFVKKNFYCNLASSTWCYKSKMSVFYFRDKDILKKSGQDAIQYLMFQRYLIIYTTIVMVLVVAIVVPVNFSGNNSMCIDQVIINNCHCLTYNIKITDGGRMMILIFN